jgi:hypothetical protein
MSNTLLLLITLAVIYTIQFATHSLVKYLNGHIRKFIKSVSKEEEFKESETFKREVENFNLISIKKEYVGFIPKIIGWFENILFIVLTIVILNFQYENLHLGSIQIIGGFVAGWMTLKIFGNYEQWAGPILGRAQFYIFLIGTVFNILLSILWGVVFYNIMSLVQL